SRPGHKGASDDPVLCCARLPLDDTRFYKYTLVCYGLFSLFAKFSLGCKTRDGSRLRVRIIRNHKRRTIRMWIRSRLVHHCFLVALACAYHMADYRLFLVHLCYPPRLPRPLFALFANHVDGAEDSDPSRVRASYSQHQGENMYMIIHNVSLLNLRLCFR
ncbi:hypothetical protein V565_062850, partial [Rhizoctonia solani 123E]